MAKEYRETEYSKKLKDPRWQKMRLEILNRDEWECQLCGATELTLHVHHRWYVNGDPWDAPKDALVTLCEACHECESNNRRESEAGLLAVLRKQYYSHDFRQIEKIFNHMPLQHIGEVQLSAVAWYLSSDKRIDEILKQFFARRCPNPGDEEQP